MAHTYHGNCLSMTSDRLASIAARRQLSHAPVTARYNIEFDRLRRRMFANPHLPVPSNHHIRQTLDGRHAVGWRIGDDRPDDNIDNATNRALAIQSATRRPTRTVNRLGKTLWGTLVKFHHIWSSGLN